MSGGLRKSADSMERLGWVSEDTAESMRGASDVMEAFAGPMELISGIVTTVAGVLYILSLMGITTAGVMGALGTAATAIGVVLAGITATMVATVVALALLAAIIYVNRDAIAEWSHEVLDLGGRLEWVNKKIKEATDGVRDFSHEVQKFGLGNFRQKIRDSQMGLGG